jgi:DNA (cytosine-5)-methyltransferase 1
MLMKPKQIIEKKLTSLEICAGGGGQALGLEEAEFDHLALVENDAAACKTLRANRTDWRVFETDVRLFLEKDAKQFIGKIDLLAGGVPCPPFSIAGKQLGQDDERDLFPVALALAKKLQPRAVMLENVRGLMQPRFAGYRRDIDAKFSKMGYRSTWKLLNSSDFGVPQLRPRVVCVALSKELFPAFSWNNVRPERPITSPVTVGVALKKLMAASGWSGAGDWAARADRIAPTLVGGSKKHGGADLGPTRAKKAWAELGVNAHGLADAPPAAGFIGMPKLNVQMAAAIQGFPPNWKFEGGKTAAYRQVGNAFPPPVAAAVARAIRQVLLNG